MLYYGMKCPFCENLIEKDDDIVICSACKTVHHKDCWKANNGCTTYACKGEKYTIEEYEESINPRPVTPIQRPKPEDLQIKKGQGDHFAGFYNKPCHNIIILLNETFISINGGDLYGIEIINMPVMWR